MFSGADASFSREVRSVFLNWSEQDVDHKVEIEESCVERWRCEVVRR